MTILIACGREQPVSSLPSTGPSDGGSSQAPADAGTPPTAEDAGYDPDAGPVTTAPDGSAASFPDATAADASPWPQPIGADPGFWIPVGPGGAPVYQVAVKPDDAQIALASASGRLFRTTNGGVRWQDTGLRSKFGMHAVAFSAAEPQRAWVVDFDGFLYSTTDAGATWTGPEKSLSLLVPGYSIGQLIPHPANAATLYAATGSGLHVSHDAGKSWAALWVPTRDLDGTSSVCTLAFQPGSPATMLSGPCGYSYSRMYRSVDAGATWTRLQTDFGGLTAVAFDPMHPNTAYAGLDYGGLPAVSRSSDGGRGGGIYRAAPDGWRRSSAGMFAEDVRGLAWTSSGRLYAATDSGLFASDDGGASWTGTAFDQGTVSIAIDSKRTIYLADYFTVRRSDDGGRSWNALQMPQGGPHLVVDDRTPGRLYAHAFGLSQSDDAGASWRTLIPGGVSAFAVDPKEPLRLYAWSDGYARGADGRFIIVNPGFKRSEDGGATWVPSADGLPAEAGAAGIVPDPVHAGRIRRGCKETLRAAAEDRGREKAQLEQELRRLLQAEHQRCRGEAHRQPSAALDERTTQIETPGGDPAVREAIVGTEIDPLRG